MSPALTGGFLTTAPPGKSGETIFQSITPTAHIPHSNNLGTKYPVVRWQVFVTFLPIAHSESLKVISSCLFFFL